MKMPYDVHHEGNYKLEQGTTAYLTEWAKIQNTDHTKY